MGITISLTAADGHAFSAYRADPGGKVKGGLVVIQEIFGVNSHMRRVADGFAAAGYLCIAPALFDRTQRGVELGYDKAAIEAGRAIRGKVTWDQVMLDIGASIRAAAAGKVGAVGYCWGGSVAWLAATRQQVAGSVCYYGGQIVPFAGEKPNCPVQMHFGELDHGIPLSDVDKIRQAQPGIEIHVYDGADHGFNCDERATYHAEAAQIARERTLAFFARCLS